MTISISYSYLGEHVLKADVGHHEFLYGPECTDVPGV